MNLDHSVNKMCALIFCSALVATAFAAPLPASWTAGFSATNTNAVGPHAHGYSLYNNFAAGYTGNGQGNFVYGSAATYSVNGTNYSLPLPGYFGGYRVNLGFNNFSYTTDVNDFGMFVGYGSLSIDVASEFAYHSHAFVFDGLTGQFTDITTNAYQAWANWINDQGTIVGTIDPGTNTGPGNGYMAFKRTSDGTFTYFAGLGLGSVGRCLNDQGDIIGNQFGLYTSRPFFIPAGATNMVVLSPPTGNFDAAEAECINNNRVIGGAFWNSVGAAQGGGTTIWTPIYNPNGGYDFNNGDGSASDQVYAAIWNQDTNGNWIAYNLNTLNISTPANVEWANVVSISDEGTMGVVARITETDVPHFGFYVLVPDAVVTPTVDPFAKWQAAHFTATQITNSAVSGPFADPDHDGLVNLYEFFHGTDPLNAASKAGLTAGLTRQSGTNFLTVQFPESKSAPNVSHSFLVSTNLSTWQSVPAKIVSRIDQGANLLVTVQDTQPISPIAPRRYLRLAITKN